MSVIRRCDNCRTETPPPTLFSDQPDDWYCCFVPREEVGLNFCQESCITDYFLSKKMINEVTE